MALVVLIGKRGRFMKKFFFLTVILYLFTGCNAKNKQLAHYVSTLENFKVLSPTTKESVIIDSLEIESRKFQEKCKRENLNCFDDEPFQDVYFKTGVSGFRKIIFKKFKVDPRAKEGENKVRITIGKNNNIEKIEVLKYSDTYSKKEIEGIFKLKELDQWRSARNHRFPVEAQFEISVFITKK